MKVLRSRENPIFKDLQRVACSSRERRSRGVTVLEGERLVGAYVDAGGVAEILAASEAAMQRDGLRYLFANAPAGVRVILDDALLERLSQVVTASGLFAVVRTPESSPLPEVLGDCLLLEGIQDPGNLGSMLRTAAAANVSRVLLSHGSVFAWSPKVVRAGMGAHFHLDIHEGIDLQAASRRAQGEILATVVQADCSLHACDLRGPIAWLFGNEAAGLSLPLAHIASRRVAIPMPGSAESLNVAAAAAICLFEQVRQRSAAGSGQ